MGEQPERDSKPLRDAPGERGPDGASRLGVPAWSPVLCALLCGGVAGWSVYRNPGHGFGLMFVAICTGTGLVFGGVFWFVDRFGPRPDHSFVLQVAGPGAVMLMLVSMLLWDREVWQHPLFAIAGLLLAVWCGALAAAGFREWMGYPDKQHVTTKLAAIGVLGLAGLFSAMALRSIAAATRGSEQMTTRAVVFVIAIAVWVAVSVFLWWKQPNRLSLETVFSALTWPVALVLKLL